MEDFVPFEIAKKLKEKGFNVEFKYSLGYYDTLGNFMSAADHWFLDSWIIAPTIYQVLKWLRKEKRIHLVVDIDTTGYFFTLNYDITIKSNNEYTYNMYIGLSAYCDAEQAYLAGIEYVIYNRI